MIKANVSHSRRLPSVRELLCFELVVELPLASKAFQLSTLSNANGRANRKLFLIRLHRECTLGQLSVSSRHPITDLFGFGTFRLGIVARSIFISAFLITLAYFADTGRERVPERS